jgi:hypothetical protein
MHSGEKARPKYASEYLEGECFFIDDEGSSISAMSNVPPKNKVLASGHINCPPYAE